MATMSEIRVPLGYRNHVRRLHHELGVPLREVKTLLTSTFYFDELAPGGYDLRLELEYLVDLIEERRLAREVEELRLLQEEARRKLARKNRWRKLTFRKPLAR